MTSKKSNEAIDIKQLNNKLDLIIELLAKNQKEWERNNNFGNFMKNWGGFYVASLIADETVKNNIT